MFLQDKAPLVNQVREDPSRHTMLTFKLQETEIAEFANSVDLDEVAHNEPPHLDLLCLLVLFAL